MDDKPVLMNPILQVAAVAPSGRRVLRAGPLSVIFDAGDLRYIKLAEGEVIRCIYVAVREKDGSIQSVLNGKAKTTFLRNRIGFCVLHPIRECAGAKCHARYTNATEKELAFPDTIAAEQPVSGLSELAGLAHEIEPGIWAEMKLASIQLR